MERFEITGGNGRGAALGEIMNAIREAGGVRVRSRFAYGLRNQPKVCTFGAADDAAARAICRRAEDALWPEDGSCLATLIAHPYS